MTHTDSVQDYFARSRQLFEQATKDAAFIAAVATIADRMARVLREGGKLLFAGNGGSAADAQHAAAEFLSRFAMDRHPLPAIALTTDTSVLTAIGNDYGYEQVFARQVQGLAKKGDAFIAISTSGGSANVLAALRTARDMGVTTIGFGGATGGKMRELCDLLLAVPSTETSLIQQVHIAAYHAICGIVERELFPTPGPAKTRP
ncbi:MAG TPA: D-sedoheptulose 7-phosphate isomerase [Xanthobacteraceae bacterium]|nr:D-sedoheptulose 7-phosphate isomerase [Xanthobacteraceae bacterium]